MFGDFNPKSKTALVFGVSIGLFIAIRCIWLWQPERQVLLHQKNFLAAVEDRNWKKVDAFLADDFQDRFGHDKAWALKESREVLRHFFALTLHDEDTSSRFEDAHRREARVTTKLRVEGSGTPIAEYAKGAVNSSREPFLFIWKQKSWKPWDWRLTKVDHPLLNHGRGGWQ